MPPQTAAAVHENQVSAVQMQPSRYERPRPAFECCWPDAKSTPLTGTCLWPASEHLLGEESPLQPALACPHSAAVWLQPALACPHSAAVWPQPALACPHSAKVWLESASEFHPMPSGLVLQLNTEC